MSAVVQELYAGLPAALSAECSALSGPAAVLEAEPEAPAFALSRGGALPPEPRRTCELKLCSRDPHEGLDHVGQMPGPRLVGLLAKKPAGTGAPAGHEEAPDGSPAEQDRLPGPLGKEAEAAGDLTGVAGEGWGCFAAASEGACWSGQEEPRLTPKGRGSLPRPSHADSAGSVQSLEGSQAGPQAPAGNAAEDAPEPVSVADDALAMGRLRGEEGSRAPRAAASGPSDPDAGGEKPSNEDQEVLPSHRGPTNLRDNSGPHSELEARDALLRGTSSSNGLFQGGLELGLMLWDEGTDFFEVVCEAQDECLGDAAGRESTAHLEGWAAPVGAREGLSAACCEGELSGDSDAEEEAGHGTDHSYSCAWEEAVGAEEGNATQSCRQETQAASPSEDGQREPNTPPQNSTSSLLDPDLSSLEGHSDDDSKSVLLASDGVQRDKPPRCSLPKDGSSVCEPEGKASLRKEAGSSAFCPSGAPASTCCAPFSCECASCKEPLWQEESTSSPRTTVGTSESLQAAWLSGTADVPPVSQEENPPVAQPSDEHLFPPESGMISSPGGLPKEEMTCAKPGRQAAAGLLCNEEELSSARQDGGCADSHGDPQHRGAHGQHDLEERRAELLTVGSPGDRRTAGLRAAAAEGRWTVSGSVCLGDPAPETRTETNAEPMEGLDVCQAPVSVQTAGPPWGLSGAQALLPARAEDSPSCQNNPSGLDGTGSSPTALCSGWMRSASLLGAADAEVKEQSTADDSWMSAEEVLDVDTHVGPPDPDPGQEFVGPGGVERVESGDGVEGGRRSGVKEKQTPGRRLGGMERPCELGRPVEGGGQEVQGPPHQERETPEGQRDLSIASNRWEGVGADQAVAPSEMDTSASCGQKDPPCPQSPGVVTPAAPALVTPNDLPQTPRQNMAGDGLPRETALESVRDPLKGEPVESGRSPELSLEGVSKRPGWTDEAEGGGCGSGSQLDLLERKCPLKFHSESASPSSPDLNLAPNPFAVASGETTTEPEGSRSSQTQKLPDLICTSAGAQNAGASLSWKDGAPTPPCPAILCCPPALTVLFGKEGNHHVGSPGTVQGSRAPHWGVCGGSLEGSKAGSVILGEIVSATPSHVDPWRKMAAPLEDHPRGGRQEKQDLPGPSPPAADSPGPSSQGVKHSSGEAAAEAGPRLPFDSSGLGQSAQRPCLQDPSVTAALVGRSEIIGGREQPPEGRLPAGPPGVLLNPVPSPGVRVPDASSRCFRSQARRWWSLERGWKQAGGGRKSPAHAVASASEGPVGSPRVFGTGDSPKLSGKALQEEAGGCPCWSWASRDGLGAEGKAEHLFEWRLRRVGRPLGALAAPAWPTSAEGRKSKRAWSTLLESKRPKTATDLVGLDCSEAGRSLLSDGNCGWTSAARKAPAPDSSRRPQTLGRGCDGIRSACGSAHKMQPSCLSRPLGKVRGTLSGPVQYEVAGKSSPVRSWACLEGPLEVVPQHKSTFADWAYPAMPEGAMRRAGTAPWRPVPESRAGPGSSLDPAGFGRLTKDQAVLRRLSVLANNLLAPPKSLRQWKQPRRCTKLLPLTGHHNPLTGRKLQEMFSCVDLKLSSWRRNSSPGCPEALSTSSLALFPVESLNLFLWEAPPFLSAPLFPVLFHIKVGSFPARSLLRTTSLPSREATGERDATAKTLSWMLSFLFPGSCLDSALVEEGAWAPTESSLGTKEGRGEDSSTQRHTGCPTRGLQTILALSSPSWYRLWTRRRHPAPRIPPVAQKLNVLQFVQGLKGFNCSSPALADFFSSVPHSLGPSWSPHGPSTCPSEFPPPHSNHCSWQPVNSATTSLRNSPAVLPQVPDQILGAPWVVAGVARVEPPFLASSPTPCSVPEPALASLRLAAPEFQAPPLDDLDAALPALPKTGRCLDKDDSEKRPKKVSQIRIRKTIPRPDPNLTPMGLPRPKRLKKKEFSLEEIYTNKNYKSPPTNRCLETIFEEPKERNGSLISISQQKRKRVLEFQDFTVPRKRRVRSRAKVLGSFTRAQKAALEERELDVLLVQKLTDLEAFFAEEEKGQAASG